MNAETSLSDVRATQLENCTQAVSRYLEEQLAALTLNAQQDLLIAARDADSRDKEQQLLSVMEEVETLCPQVAEAFHDSVLANLRSPDIGLNLSSQADQDGLDLVETAKVDGGVQLLRLLTRHPPQAQALEVQVWERLSTLAGVSAHVDDCPVSLQGMCLLFQGAMQNLGAGRESRNAIFKSFEATVAAELGHLITELDGQLSDEDLANDKIEEISTPQKPPLPKPDIAQDETQQAELDLPLEVTPNPEDPTRLLGVLASLSRNAENSAAQEQQLNAESLETWLTESVTPAGVVLETHQRHTVAVIASLVEQIVEHPDVDDGVKRRLRKLAPPLLMLTLQGDDYLESELDTARHDPLTGLLDRHALRARLESSLGQSTSTDTGTAVCLIDIDGFSTITAKLGHQVGGRVLRALGDLLHKHAGASALVGRIRGDEFVVVFPSARAGFARRFAERYLSALSKSRFVFDGEEVNLSASVGVVESDQGLATVPALMQAADSARRAAKAAGGGCLSLFATEDGHR